MYSQASLDRASNHSGSMTRSLRFPLSPSDSVASLSSFRPSLVWLFNHIRRDEERESLTKEDLRQLLGAAVDNAQLDEAFTRLDTDGDGEVSLDEFLSGFARFWKEAPHTPGHESLHKSFFMSPQHLGSAPDPVVVGDEADHGVVVEQEEFFETSLDGTKENGGGVSENFQQHLEVLSSHNRHSIEALWRSLNDSNPELLVDFEDFVAEIAGEVQGAQRALDKQRQASKYEAIELDEEIESRLQRAHTTLQMQTAIAKQQARDKVQGKLVEKELELHSVKSQLQELAARLETCCRFALQLETEIVQGHRVHSQLEQQCQELNKEKHELLERLTVSERQLDQTQSKVLVLEESSVQENSQQQMVEQESDLLRQVKDYEHEIEALRQQLDSQMSMNEEEVGEGVRMDQPPDLLATSQLPLPRKGSIMDEIMQKEGASSPLLRAGSLRHHNSPRRRGTKRGGGGGPPKTSGGGGRQRLHLRSSSLPNLADVEQCEEYMAGEGGGGGGGGVTGRGSARDNRKSMFVQMAEYDDEPMSEIVHPQDAAMVTAPPTVYVTSTPLGSAEDAEGDPPAIVHDNEPAGGNDENPLPDTPSSTISHPLADMFDVKCKPIEFIETLATHPDYVFKILVVGNSYVGKSSFLMQLCTSVFSQRYSSTIGVDFYSKALRLDEKIISLQLWDTAGQERFQSVTKAYYRGAQGVILMYDVAQEESFIAVKSWINSIQDNTDQMPSGLLLVGNKVDLDDQGEREVSVETGETFAKIYGAGFIETSAKTGFNVSNALLLLVRMIKRHFEEEKVNARGGGGGGGGKGRVRLASEQAESKCCGR